MAAILALDGVSKSYGALKVTDDISLSVTEGETLGILGPNGAGKTTLFNLISGDVRADAGRVSFDGQRREPRAAAPALPPRDRALVPDPPALRRDDRVREPRRRGVLRLATPGEGHLRARGGDPAGDRTCCPRRTGWPAA